MATETKTNPTARAREIYNDLIEDWGEPTYLFTFDSLEMAKPGRLPRLDVAIWSADDECDVTSCVTIGLSNVALGLECTTRYIELHWALRRHLDERQAYAVAAFLANVAEYPFDYGQCLDWWHRLTNPGHVPHFPSASTILFRPPFSSESKGELIADGETVRFLYMVPLADPESHLIKREGVSGYLDHLEANELDPLGTA